MKIEISGTADEMKNFLDSVLKGEAAEQVIRSLRLEEGISFKEETDPEDSALFSALDSMSWDTFFVAHLVSAKYTGKGPSGLVMKLDELSRLQIGSAQNLPARKIMARVGDLPPVIVPLRMLVPKDRYPLPGPSKAAQSLERGTCIPASCVA